MTDPQNIPFQPVDTVITKRRLPFLYLFFGTILSITGPVLFLWLLGWIYDTIRGGSNLIPNINILAITVFADIIGLGILFLLAIINHRLGKQGYMWSYLTIVIINVLVYCFFYAAVSTIHC
jgi:hypothetical protein